MIKNLTFGVYLIISDFPVESLKTNKNQQKKSLILQYIFTQETSLILGTSTNATLQKIYSQHSQKHVSCWCQKKHCTAPFLDDQEPHSQRTCLHIPVNLCSKIFFPETQEICDCFSVSRYIKRCRKLCIQTQSHF